MAVMIPIQLKMLPLAARDPIHSASSGKPVHTLMLISMLAAESMIRSSSASGFRLVAIIVFVRVVDKAISLATPLEKLQADAGAALDCQTAPTPTSPFSSSPRGVGHNHAAPDENE